MRTVGDVRVDVARIGTSGCQGAVGTAQGRTCNLPVAAMESAQRGCGRSGVGALLGTSETELPPPLELHRPTQARAPLPLCASRGGRREDVAAAAGARYALLDRARSTSEPNYAGWRGNWGPVAYLALPGGLVGAP